MELGESHPFWLLPPERMKFSSSSDAFNNRDNITNDFVENICCNVVNLSLLCNNTEVSNVLKFSIFCRC